MNEKSRDEVKELQKKITILEQKVYSKTDTIVRLGQDLEHSEREKREFLARIKTLERNLERVERDLEISTVKEESMRLQFSNEKQDLVEDMNRYKKEAQTLRTAHQELIDDRSDLKKDCKIFRQTIARYEVEKLGAESKPGSSRMDTTSIQKHEELQYRYKQMESDMKVLLGVKEELLIDRDELLKKVSRLNSELAHLLNGDPTKVPEDIDSLIGENRFLKAQLSTAQEESESIKSTLAKYKTMAESVKPMLVRGSSSSEKDTVLEEKTSVAVINMRQIRELLASQSIELDESDHRAITAILLDLCNEKQMALAHLRRANKVLGTRLHELEVKMATSEKCRSTSPRNENELKLPK